MKQSASIILLLLFFEIISGQKLNSSDSLTRSLNFQNEDTLKVKTYISICNKIVYSDPNLSHDFGNKALKLSEKLNWPKGIALAYSVIGDAYENQGDNSKALAFRLKELKI